jgi:hypothetical protein
VSMPSTHAHSSSAASFIIDGLRLHQIRPRSMASRTRSSTVVERLGHAPGLQQPARVTNFDKRVSRDDMMLGGRQFGRNLDKPAFDNRRISRDDMSIASKSYGMYAVVHGSDRRMSRDDMAIPVRQFDRTNYKSYHVPIRGRMPTPDSSPNNDTLQGVTTVRTATPESMDDNKPTGLIAIGMALGSPAHPPWAPPPPSQPVTMHSTVSASSLEMHDSHDDAQSKTKSRKWGFFGRSKSKRGKGPEPSPLPVSSDTPQLPPQAQALVSPGPETPATAQSLPAEEPKRRKSLRRRPTISRLQKPPVPEVRAEKPPVPEVRAEPQRDLRSVPASIDLISASRLHLPGGPFLDVEIPSVEMERYSVMFGNVLNPHNPHHPHPHITHNPQSSSSLLARRQATLDRVKTTRDDLQETQQLAPADEWPRPRRATSPQPTRTPSFNIFPSTPAKAGEARGVSPKTRSRTLPSNPSPAPREPSSALSQPVEKSLPSAPVETRAPEPVEIVSIPVATPKEHPRLVSKFNKQSPKTLSPRAGLVESPTQIEPSVEAPMQTRSATVPAESTWQVASPPLTTRSYEPAGNSGRQGSPSTQIKSPEPEPDNEDNRALQDAVEISIARQISVSRQQRTMLRPVQGSIRGRKDASPNGVGISTKIIMGRKGSTPTLVLPEPQEAAVNGLAMHRKSSRGIIEGPAVN